MIILIILIIPVFVGGTIIWLFSLPFDRNKIIMHNYLTLVGRLIIGVNAFWSVQIEGKENLNPDKISVLISNHQSFLDIPFIQCIRFHFRWVSKQEIFKIPFIGILMHMARYISLRRGDRKSIMRMIKQGTNALNTGNSLMMFPEGTRSKSGKIQPFKNGAFELAKKTNSSIIPLLVYGTKECVHSHGIIPLLTTQKVIIKILPPMSAKIVKQKTLNEVKNEIYTKMQYHFDNI